MRSTRKMWIAALGAAAIGLLSSCSTQSARQAERPGPVPQGPAYGDKHIYGYDLVYDPNWGVYVVTGLTDCFYDEGFFYRLRSGAWEISLQADQWQAADLKMLTPHLRTKAKAMAKPDDKGVAKARKAGPPRTEGGPMAESGQAASGETEPLAANGQPAGIAKDRR